MSSLSEQGQAILEELEITVMSDLEFDKRFQIDPETTYPIPTYRNGKKDDGVRTVYYLGIPTELAAGITGGPLACSPALRDKHKLLVWAGKNESKIREECGGEQDE